MKKGELVRRAGQVFVIAGSSDTAKQRAASAALAAAGHVRTADGPVGGASHLLAANLFGFRTVDTDIIVSVRYPRKLTIPKAKVVRSVDLVADDITWIDGIPTTTPERTICDLGLDLPESEVLRILRHAVATGMVNRRDVTRMRWRISKQGRNGAGISDRCLSLLPDLTEATESGLEAMFLEICEKERLPTPTFQLPVVANGRQYRLDFAYPSVKVFVEIDGSGHGEARQISKDGGRQNDLVAHGWQPVRFDYQMLRVSPGYCADVLRQVLAPTNHASTRNL
ncbi:MAG: very-short-patch-repair endonuclease [Paracrocinitomix sp.]